METVVLLLFFIVIGITGFIIKKLDVFHEENRKQEKCALESRENVIKIACENPIMLSSVSDALEKTAKEFKETSFYFYTGCRTDMQRMLENGSADIILLMEEMHVEDNGSYGKKIGSFFPSSLSEPLTGLTIEPIEKQQMVMCVLWNKKHITEKQRELISNI